MEARFGRIILQLVDKALQEEPGRKPLLNLLQISDPELSKRDVLDTKKREASFRSFKLLIHPDKHPSDSDAATTRFQKAQTFYDDCVRLISRKRSYSSSPRSNTLPLQFHIQDKWPFLAKMHNEPVLPADETVDERIMEITIAFRCINFRGSIAHGKKPELRYNSDNVRKENSTSAQSVFEKLGGGCKRLASIEDIKEEIMNRGPVISASFQLTKAFLNAGDHAHAFDAALVDHMHAVLIVGWKQTAYGEVWLVRASKGTTCIPISVGQFDLEEHVNAPCSDFMDESWQIESKAFDIPKLPSDWYTWPKIEWKFSNEGTLLTLFKALGCSWATALTSKAPFVIRQKDKKARSRYAYLTDIELTEDKKEWQLQATFCDQKWE